MSAATARIRSHWHRRRAWWPMRSAPAPRMSPTNPVWDERGTDRRQDRSARRSGDHRWLRGRHQGGAQDRRGDPATRRSAAMTTATRRPLDEHVRQAPRTRSAPRTRGAGRNRAGRWRRRALALVVIAVIVALLAGGLWAVYYSGGPFGRHQTESMSSALAASRPVQVGLTRRAGTRRRAVGPSGPGCDCRAADRRAVH